MRVAGAEEIDDASARSVAHGALAPDDPVAGTGPRCSS
jgi:hypothetical protein